MYKVDTKWYFYKADIATSVGYQSDFSNVSMQLYCEVSYYKVDMKWYFYKVDIATSANSVGYQLDFSNVSM